MERKERGCRSSSSRKGVRLATRQNHEKLVRDAELSSLCAAMGVIGYGLDAGILHFTYDLPREAGTGMKDRGLAALPLPLGCAEALCLLQPDPTE